MDRLLLCQQVLRDTFGDVREWMVDMPTTLYGCLAMAMTYQARWRAEASPFLGMAVRATKEIRAIIEDNQFIKE
jgi:hypothetical protein